MPSTVSLLTPPPRLAAGSAPGKSARRMKYRKAPVAATPAPDPRATLARKLACNADLLLSWGQHVAAERLSLRAEALREVEASA